MAVIASQYCYSQKSAFFRLETLKLGFSQEQQGTKRKGKKKERTRTKWPDPNTGQGEPIMLLTVKRWGIKTQLWLK